MITLSTILGVSGSHYHTTTDALEQLGIERSQPNTLMPVHEHAVTSLHNLVMSRRVLERGSESRRKAQVMTGPPYRPKFTPFFLCVTHIYRVSRNCVAGCPWLHLEAPVMTPKGVDFSFLFFLHTKGDSMDVSLGGRPH